MSLDHPTPRLANESSKAYAAFLSYIALPSDQRSIDRAWRSTLTDQGQSGGNKRAPSHWEEWSSRFDWVARSVVFDEHVTGLDAAAWLQRRRELRERDWQQADELRNVVDAGLTTAAQFVYSKAKYIPASDGKPARIIVRERFDLGALVRALIAASKLQHAACFLPDGDELPLSATALDAIIDKELQALVSLRAEKIVLEVSYTNGSTRE